MRDRAIAFTLYRRPFYTRPVLEAWKKVAGVKDWDVHFYIDPSDQVDAQFMLAEEFLEWHNNGTVQVNSTKQGVLKAPWTALEHTFTDKGIEYAFLAEEDVEVSNDVLEYVEFALVAGRSQIACAWSDEEDKPDDEALLRQWFCPWGWATDRRTWQLELKDTWDTDYSTGDETGPGGWDCNIGLRLVGARDLKIMFPRQSRSQHIGKHLGVHQDPSAHGQLEMPKSFTSEREQVVWRVVQNA
jgi:hypothetical protein